MNNSESTSAQCRVLVVEDEYFIADDLAKALARRGAQVVGPMARTRDALAYLEHAGPLDLAVLDVNLGGELVFPLAAALRERGTRFAFVTGYDRLGLPPEFRDVACWDRHIAPDRLAALLLAPGAMAP